MRNHHSCGGEPLLAKLPKKEFVTPFEELFLRLNFKFLFFKEDYARASFIAAVQHILSGTSSMLIFQK
ncbi:MAG: hypothetical protein WA939_25160 [Nodosilinea sp.]